jgi:O-antigen biosynthesis protein
VLIKKAFDLGLSGISKRIIKLGHLVYALYKLHGFRYIARKVLQLFRNGNFRERVLVISRSRIQDSTPDTQVISGKKWVGHIDDAEIIVVSNALQVASYEYRARNIAQAFALNGYKVYNMEEFDFMNSIDMPESVRLVYFCRTTSTPKNIRCWQNIRSRVRIAFDVDDLIFSSDAYNVKNAPGLLEISEKARHHLTGEYIEIQREIIRNCDFLTAPTNAIVHEYSKITSAPSFLVPNVMPVWMIEQAIDAPKRENKGLVKIGYASGTSTHSGDFATAKSGIWKSLEDHPNAVLVILGASPISSSQIPEHLVSQVEFKKLVPHEELINQISSFDINLAPLELNPFTEAKSELKFVHAALLGIPTVASPTEPFRKIIRNGENGYLANTTEEWHQSLNSLIESSQLRNLLGFEAYLSLRSNYTIPSISRIFEERSSSIWNEIHG